jgi:ATP-binding cassette subfamily B protein
VSRGLGGGVWHGPRGLRYLDGKGGATAAAPVSVRRVLAYLLPHGRLGVAVLGLIIASSILGLVPPLLVKRILDVALPGRRLGLLDLLALAMVAAPALGGLVSVGQTYLTSCISQGIMLRLRGEMYRHLQTLGLRHFTGVRAGETVSRVVTDVGAVQDVLITTATGLVSNSLTLVFTLAVMTAMDSRLALVAVAVLPIFALPVARVGRVRYDLQARTQAELADLTAHVAETLSLDGITLVRTFGAEAREADRFDAVAARVRDLSIRQSLVGRWLFAFVGVLQTAGPAAIYWLGGREVMAGRMTVGGIVAFAAYLVQLYGPASNLVNLQVNFRGAMALFARIFQVLDTPPEVRESPVPLHLADVRGVVAFEGVRFGYDPARPVLHGIDFVADAGEMVALVGPSGAGKTTIIQLLARFYDPDQGRVTLDGHDLRDLSFATLRRSVALVAQEPALFHTSIRQNARYGAPGADDEAVLAALEAAQLGELVRRLPDGLDTVVGERGYRLSGGEKQRLALARALLADPRVLVLDEATSNLDSLAERSVQRALERLLRDRTAVVIAHRLSTVVAADRILVVADGRIVESGRHEDLRARGGLYERLCREQFDRTAPAAAPAG